MTTTSTSLARLAEDWPGWASMFEGRLGVPEVLHILDGDRIRVEEFHENSTVVVRAELPGVDPDKDIEITVTDGALQIRAHREERHQEEQEGRYRSEFRYGSFMRRVPLPQGASDADVKATYHDGILEVRIPVEEETGPSPTTVPVTRT